MADDKSVQEFVNLTGASVEIARSLLEACSGNLELAIGMHLDSMPVPSDLQNRGLEEPDPAPSSAPSTYEETHGVRAPIPQTQGVLIEHEPIPRRSFHRRKLPASVFDPFQDFSQMSSSSSSSTSRKHQVLAELFKPPSDIMFHGTFHEARSYGQSQQRWLLVNIQDSKEFSCQVLNRDIWRNATVRKLLKDNFIFIQIQRITDDGNKFQQLYDVSTYPTVLIIDPRTGEKMVNLQDFTLSNFLTEVREFLAFNSLKNKQKSPKKPSVYDQSEKDQLEAAIKASMGRETGSNSVIIVDSDSDQLWSPDSCTGEDEANEECDDGEKSTGAVDEPVCVVSITNNERPSIVTGGNKRKRVEESMAEMEIDPLVSVPPTKQFRYYNRTDSSGLVETNAAPLPLPLPPSSSLHDNEPECGLKEEERTRGRDEGPSLVEMCTLLIRCPDGRRILKSFKLDNPIRDLFSYLSEEGISLTQYEVITTFPRTIVSLLPCDTTFRQAGLYPRQTVHVQLIDDE